MLDFAPNKQYFLPSNGFLTCNVAKLHYILLGMQYFTVHLDFRLVSIEQHFTSAHAHKVKCVADALRFLSCLLFLSSFSLSFFSRYLIFYSSLSFYQLQKFW